MKYSIEDLQGKILEGNEFEYITFYGHTHGEKLTKACFSQWYDSPFVLNDVVYPTAEHWMMAEKARLFGDEVALKLILLSKDPATAKSLGRKVKNFDNITWLNNCERIVTEGNMAKFSQNEELMHFLLETSSAVLVEASPRDTIWGIGLKHDHIHAKNPLKWNGTNFLGFCLMEVRDRLPKEYMSVYT